MSIRSNLYSWFENFDKPDEDQFRVFIDAALRPTIYKTATIIPATDIYTDINQQSFSLDIRECYYITYGNQIYILFGIEGVYGAGGIEITSENLTFVGNTNTAALESTLTANTSIVNAGIKSGDSFPVGTTLEQLFRDLLIITKISNLRFQANDISGFMEVGTSLNITKFLWTVAGTPVNLYLSDSEGQYGASVSGTEVTVAESYSYSSFKQVIWSLSGDNVDTITTSVYWVEPSYYGTNTTGLLPTEGEILAGVKLLKLTSAEIEVPIDTDISEYGWISVDATQTGALYTEWIVTDLNRAAIGATEFIKYAGDVTVNGKIHNVYLFNWNTEVDTIKLS